MILKILCLALFALSMHAQVTSSSSGGGGGTNSNNVVGYINAGSSLSTAITSCGVNQTTIQISQAIAVGTGITVPSNCTLWFQSGGQLTGTSIVINGKIQASQAQPIFGAGLAVTGLSGSVPVDWFGAVPYATLSAAAAGTDSTASLQACINSLTQKGSCLLDAGAYRTTAALSITTSAVGIKGTAHGHDSSGTSTILSTSASADILDLTGTSGTYIVWNTLEDFSVQRSVAPTGTASGIAVSYAGGLSAERIQSEDSVRDIYLHGTPSYGLGWRDVVTGWGYSIPTGYTGTLYGWYFDSSDGVGMNSVYLDNVAASNNLGSSPTTYGYYIAGTHINDVDLDNINTAGTTHGLYINYTGTGVGDSEADIHINHPTFDVCLIDCIYINGVSSLGGQPSVIVDAGYITTYNRSTNAVRLVDIENSSGVAITNNMMFSDLSTATTGIYVNGSTALTLSSNKCQSMLSDTCIKLVGTTGSSIIGNTMIGSSSFTMAAGISLTSTSTGNTVTGNAASGYITTAYNYDGTSLANDVAGNSCSGVTGACTSGAPTGTASSYLATGSAVNGSAICTSANALCTTSGVSSINSTTGAMTFTGAGVVQTGNTFSFTGGNNASPITNLSDQTLVSAAASVTFASIPGTYRHLRILYTAQASTAGDQDVTIKFNGDTGNSYDRSYMFQYGSGSGTTTFLTGGTSTPTGPQAAGHVGGTNGDFSSGEIIINNYTSTVAQKHVTGTFSGRISSTALLAGSDGVDWRSATAITSVTLTPASGNFQIGSSFTLYGWN